jgi:hypothetical protein
MEKYYKFTVKDYFGNTEAIDEKEFSALLSSTKANKKNNYMALRNKLRVFFADDENKDVECDVVKSVYIENFLRKNSMFVV